MTTMSATMIAQPYPAQPTARSAIVPHENDVPQSGSTRFKS